jgi:hypothetical protein
MALEAASKAFRASAVCAEAVPANSMSSPARMQSLRAIRFPRSHKFIGKTKEFDFRFDISNGDPYTPKAPD